MCGKVSRGFDLVNSPFIFQFTCSFIRHGERSMFNRMCQLEYDADHKTCEEGKDQEAHQPGNEPNHINGNKHIQSKVQNLGSPEIKMIHKAHFLQWGGSNLIA